jgi:hypothetical protein
VVAFAAVAFACCEPQADAQIVGTTTSAFVIPTTPTALNGSFTIPYTLQESTANALVVGTYIDNTHTISSMLHGGVAPQTVVTDQRVNLYYFENPADVGDFTFNYSIATDNSPNFAFMVLELLDVDLNGTVDTGTGNTINTTVGDQFIVSMIGLNNDDGNVLAPATGSLLVTAAISNANGGIGGGSLGAGFVDKRKTGPAGSKAVGWQGNDLGFFQGQASIALQAPPLAVDVTLVVNKSTGEVKLRNDTGGPISFDYYRVQSVMNALDPTGWNSLDDQGIGSLPADFDGNGSVGASDLAVWQTSYGVNSGADADGDGDTDGRDFLAWQRAFGQAPGPADTWIEAGGSTTSVIGELLLNGATSLAPGQELTLGAAYNEAVFGASDGDLVFDISLGNSTQLVEGLVEYVTGAGMSAVPEPSAIVVCLFAFSALLQFRR